MYTQNTSATVNSAIGVAPNTPPIGAPYYAQSPAVRYEFLGAWYGNDEGEYGWKGIYIYRGGVLVWNNGYGNNPADASKLTGTIGSYNHGGSAAYNPWLLADTTFTWKTYAWGYSSPLWTLKTIAQPLAQGPVSFSGQTKTAIGVTVGWFANTNESTALLTLYYKKPSEGVWTPWATTSGNQSGYAGLTYSTTVTGLESGTTYQFRAVVSRTVSPAEANTTWDLGSTATLPASPTAATTAASGIADTYAVMNATVDPNTIACTVSFQYGTTSGMYTAETATQAVTGDGDRTVSFGQGSLAANTTYYFRVKVTYDLGAGTVAIYGSELSFTTTIDQGTLARAEDLMQTLQFDGQYGTGRYITFTLKTKATDGSDQYYVTAPTNTQCKIYLTSAAGVTTGPANATNSPAQPGGAGTPIFRLELEDAEMAAETIDIIVTSGGATFRDQHIQIRTAQRLSELDIDATNGPTNATALTAIGNGSGDGIKAVGGATGLDFNAVIETNWLRVGVAREEIPPLAANQIKLDSNASTTNDYYNGCILGIISGTGVGQSRIIVDYVGGADPDVAGNRVATLDSDLLVAPDDTSLFVLSPGPRVWEITSPGELDSLPTETSSYGEFLRLLFQRFAFRIEQNADYQTWFRADSDPLNPLASRAVEDDGNTQRLYRLAE